MHPLQDEVRICDQKTGISVLLFVIFLRFIRSQTPLKERQIHNHCMSYPNNNYCQNIQTQVNIYKSQAKYAQNQKNDSVPQPNLRKLTYFGTGASFITYANALTNQQLAICQEVDFSLFRRQEHLQEAEVSQDLDAPLLVRCCPQCCLQGCACLVCLFSCLIMVLFFWIILPVMYCCVKSKVEKLVDATIPLQAYQSLKQLAGRRQQLQERSGRISKAAVKVEDSHLSTQKVECLRSFIEQSQLESIQFENAAFVINQSEESWVDFDKNMAHITAIPNLRYLLKWQNKILQK